MNVYIIICSIIEIRNLSDVYFFAVQNDGIGKKIFAGGGRQEIFLCFFNDIGRIDKK